MKFGKVALALLLAAGISIGTALLGERWVALWSGRTAGIAGGAAELKSLPDFVLADAQGRETASTAWAGKILLLNYWATWCTPCTRQLTPLADIRRSLGERGVAVVGIAVDRAADVQAFLAARPLDYPILIATPEAVELARRLGNPVQGLPFTVLFDARGRRVFSQVGALDVEALRAQLARLLGDLPDTARPEAATAPP